MLKFTSSADLSRLHKTDPAHPIISLMVDNLFSDASQDVITLMESHDIAHPLTELCNAEDVSLEGVIEQKGNYLVVLQTKYDFGLVIVVPNTEWLGGELRQSIEQNLVQLPTAV
jgi:hypothetical protein